MTTRAAIALILLSACAAAPTTSPECEPSTTARIDGSATATTLEDGSLHVTGTAVHVLGLAIRRVRVAGHDATPDEGAFNFSRFTATLTPAELALLPADDAGHVAVPIVVEDACRIESALNALGFDRALVRVDALTVDVDYPGDETYLPLTFALPATLTVGATGRGADARVHLVGASGAFDGAEGDGTTIDLRLGKLSDEAATARTFFTATRAGKHAIDATLGTKTVHAEVKVAGPPAFSLDSGVIDAGTTRLEVTTEGRLATCEILNRSDATIDYRDDDATGAIEIDPDDANRATFFVSAVSGDSGELEITCRDAFGQAATATYELVP